MPDIFFKKFSTFVIQRKLLIWGLLFVFFISIACMFLFCIPYQDELAYAYKSGMRTNDNTQLERIASLSDIVKQQYADYKSAGNGRLLIHGILAFFSAFRLNVVFRILSTCIWFLFTYLILKASKLHVANIKTFLLGALIVYWFLWHSETTCRDASYTINYLWMATWTLVGMWLWRHLNYWWQVPFGVTVHGGGAKQIDVSVCLNENGRLP